MEDMTESTRSTLSYESRVDSQSMLDHYVREMPDCLREDPWSSTPEIWAYITSGGPCARPKGVMHLFAALKQFRRTCRRMDVLRWAVIMKREDELPLGQEPQTLEEIHARTDVNRRDECMLRWCPDIWSCEPYDEAHRRLPQDKTLCYRHSPDDSDGYFEAESGDEVPTQSTDSDMDLGD